MADPTRAGRLAKRIQHIVAEAIKSEIKDARLEFVTITDARVTGDLHDATVYYTVRGVTLAEEPDLEAAAAALTKATGALRSAVGAGTGVRYTPTLRFELDSVPEAARHMSELLARARELDAKTAAQAKDATPAGEADPYKRPADEGAEAADEQG